MGKNLLRALSAVSNLLTIGLSIYVTINNVSNGLYLAYKTKNQEKS
jgi:hypothetical protein